MNENIDIVIFGSPDDPRRQWTPPPGITLHFEPPAHPEDLTVFRGIPVTSPSRTLVDGAEYLSRDELREAFVRARELGLLDIEAVKRCRARIVWRASFAMLDEVIDEFS